jgi:hypothetical protein
MGLILVFLSSPLPFAFDMSNDGLTPFVHMHVFHRNLLLALPRWRFNASRSKV